MSAIAREPLARLRQCAAQVSDSAEDFAFNKASDIIDGVRVRNSTDYYELLHLQPDAPDALIKASYRTLMQKLKMHPDLGGDADAASLLNEAYDTLGNPTARAKYDSSRTASSRPAENAQTQHAYSKPSPAAAPKRVMWRKTDSKAAAQCLFCSTLHSFHTYPPRSAACSGCSSPLAPAETRGLLVDERRALERLHIERYIEYRSLPGTSMRRANTSDLSLRGLKFSAADDLISNQLIQISSQFCHALGRIAHVANSNVSQHEFGIEFVTLCFPNATGSLVSTHA